MNNKVTIVSAFYMFKKSKHSLQNYQQWIYNFLSFVDTPIVMFSEDPFCGFMYKMRMDAFGPERTAQNFRIIKKPFNDVKFSSPEWIDTWNKQVSLSNFSHLHGHELYRVWANKPFFVEEAMKLNPFRSDTFVWCDAGCWRDQVVARICGPGWPVQEKITPNQMHIITIEPLKPALRTLGTMLATRKQYAQEELVKAIDLQNKAFVGGTILLGDKTAWDAWIPAFETTLNLYIKNNLFAGDDQAVIGSTVLWMRYNALVTPPLSRLNPNFMLIPPNHPLPPILYESPKGNAFFVYEGIRMGDIWFAFQQHFSRHDFTLTTY